MNVKYCQLPGRIAMDNLHRITCPSQQLFYFFRNKDGAMLASSAAKANGQIALAFAHIMRDQIDQQRGDAVNKFLCLWERPNILRDLRMSSGIRAKRWDEVWIRQKAHIKQQISIIGHAGLVAKANDRNHNVLV